MMERISGKASEEMFVGWLQENFSSPGNLQHLANLSSDSHTQETLTHGKHTRRTIVHGENQNQRNVAEEL